MQHDIIITDEGFSDLNPVQFGYENCNKLHSFGPAVRTHWLIHFVESGCGIFKIRDKEYKVSPGEMFIIPNNEYLYATHNFFSFKDYTKQLKAHKL